MYFIGSSLSGAIGKHKHPISVHFLKSFFSSFTPHRVWHVSSHIIRVVIVMQKENVVPSMLLERQDGGHSMLSQSALRSAYQPSDV